MTQKREKRQPDSARLAASPWEPFTRRSHVGRGCVDPSTTVKTGRRHHGKGRGGTKEGTPRGWRPRDGHPLGDVASVHHTARTATARHSADVLRARGLREVKVSLAGVDFTPLTSRRTKSSAATSSPIWRLQPRRMGQARHRRIHSTTRVVITAAIHSAGVGNNAR
jgi:hypothetical protein